jgi:D-serine deaminase-like pyridoxal phosphate-dependent protein
MRSQAQRRRSNLSPRLHRPTHHLRNHRCSKVQRLLELFSEHKDIRIVVDSAEDASAINTALSQSGIAESIQTLIELDVGLHRIGVQPGPPCLQLARHIASLPHLKIIGIQGYEGHLQRIHSLDGRKNAYLDSMHILTSTADSVKKQKGRPSCCCSMKVDIVDSLSLSLFLPLASAVAAVLA